MVTNISATSSKSTRVTGTFNSAITSVIVFFGIPNAKTDVVDSFVIAVSVSYRENFQSDRLIPFVDVFSGRFNSPFRRGR